VQETTLLFISLPEVSSSHTASVTEINVTAAELINAKIKYFGTIRNKGNSTGKQFF